MTEPLVLAASISAGAAVAIAVLGAGASSSHRAGTGWQPWLASRRRRWVPTISVVKLRAVRERVAGELDRAGVGETPERVSAALAGVTVSCCCLAAAAGSLTDPPTTAGAAAITAAGVPVLALLLIRRRIGSRRRRLTAQLGPLLELLSLELSSGAAPGPALEAVLRRLDGDLAGELRVAVAATIGPGTSSLDQRLVELGDRFGIPALLSLAGIIATSREYGSSLSPGVRALAAELRRARRRYVIADSRRALNRVLVPSAVGVLAPFMAILLYPAITTLSHSLR